MSQKPPNILYGYFPLWGATFDSQEVGLIGGSVSAMIPYKDEWRLIQKSDVWLERFRNAAGAASGDEHADFGPEPPPCLVVILALAEDESFAEGVERLKDEVVEEARDAVLAMRLYKPGWFIDPEMAEVAFVQQPYIVRMPGPYRQAFMEGPPEELPARYAINVAELSPHKGMPSSLASLWNLVEQYNHVAHHSTADIAIENFNRSFGFQLKGTQRAALLYTSIDALLGGMSARRIGGLKLKTRFRERVEAALHAVHGTWIGTDSSPEDLAKWLDTSGRRIRNAVAHGEAASVAVEADGGWEYIQLILRVLLRQYLEFSVKWFKDPVGMQSRLGLPDQVAPVIGYNCALELKVKNGMDIDDLLRFDVSRV